MDEDTERELVSAIEEQHNMKLVEKLAGNTVKEEFHKGALFGMKPALSIMGELEKVRGSGG